MDKSITKKDLFAVSWLPKSCHRNMSKGINVVTNYVGKPLYYCKLSTSLYSMDSARAALEFSFNEGSIALEPLSLKAYPGSVDYCDDQPGSYKSSGHSFYVSIVPSAICDSEGFYALNDLLVHDPGLLPLDSLRKGVDFFRYLQCVVIDFHKIFYAFEFFANPALFIPAPIPKYNFSFDAANKDSLVAAPLLSGTSEDTTNTTEDIAVNNASKLA